METKSKISKIDINGDEHKRMVIKVLVTVAFLINNDKISCSEGAANYILQNFPEHELSHAMFVFGCYSKEHEIKRKKSMLTKCMRFINEGMFTNLEEAIEYGHKTFIIEVVRKGENTQKEQDVSSEEQKKQALEKLKELVSRLKGSQQEGFTAKNKRSWLNSDDEPTN